MTTPRIQKWVGEIEKIRGQFTHLLHLREIFDEVIAIIKNNPNLKRPSSLYAWFDDTYSTTVAIGIRRLVYPSQGAICLKRLLGDIKNHSSAITRQHYVSLYERSCSKIANQHFDKLAGKGTAHLQATNVQQDIDRLTKNTLKIKDFADQHIAHIDPKAAKALATWKDLSTAFGVIDKILKKYMSLLKAEAWVNLKPTIQDNWKYVFKFPWLP